MTIGDFNGDGYGDLVYELQGNDTSGAFANLYGGPFTAAIARGRAFATQFHPEKSQAKGLQIYQNFVSMAAAAVP